MSVRRIAVVAGKVVAGLVIGLAATVAALAGYLTYAPKPVHAVRKLDVKVELTPARVAEGRRIATMLCAACHGDPTTGALTGHHMTDIPPAFGEIRTANITADKEHGIGAWTDGELVHLLRTGIKRDGTFAPVMLQFPQLSDEDVYSIVAFLRSDDPMVRPVAKAAPRSKPSLMAKFFIRFVMKPSAFPAAPIAPPDRSDPVAFGRYLAVAKFDCVGCHKADFAGGEELLDASGQPVLTANLTPHASGIEAYTEAEFVRAVRQGRSRDNHVLRVMPVFSLLQDDELKAIYAFLRTVPPVEKHRPRRAPAVVQVSDVEHAGRQVYEKYQCAACHGLTGLGNCDLRGAAAKYSDGEIADFVRNPAARVPGSRMPAWEGVISEEEMAPLAAYVRALGEGRGGSPVQTASR